MARAARDADLRDDVQDEVLGLHAAGQRTIDGDAHGPGLGLEDALTGEDHLDLRRADAEGHGSQRAVGRGVAVSADDRHARLRKARLGADDVDDPLARIADAEVFDAVPCAVLRQSGDLPARLGVLDRELLSERRDVVVGRSRDSFRACDVQAAVFDSRKGDGRGHLVDVLAVDVEHAAAALLFADDVCVPDLVEQCPSHGLLLLFSFFGDVE